MTIARRMRGIVAALRRVAARGLSREESGATTSSSRSGRSAAKAKSSATAAAISKPHPNVRVDIQQMPLTAAHEKLLTAFAGDALPDIGQLGNTWIPEFVAVGALEPLQPYLDKSTVIDAKDYFPGIWDTNVIDGTLYGVPWYVDTRLLFYRNDLLADAGFPNPPRDWDEWTQALAAVKANAGQDNYRDLPAAQRIRAAAESRPAADRSACSTTTTRAAISKAPAFATRWISTSRCSAAAGRRR